jgi:hypothetical protein
VHRQNRSIEDRGSVTRTDASKTMTRWPARWPS